jgi:hypothetical protein
MQLPLPGFTNGVLVPSFHFPAHKQPPSPPQFRDFNLPSVGTRRPDEIIAPSGMLGIIPDDIATAGGHNVPFRVERTGFGRRIPTRPEGLNTLPGRHQMARNNNHNQS